MSKDVEVMENVIEPVVETPVEVVPPTPEISFDVQSIGKSFSNRVGDVAMNMIASAAVVGAANGAMWVGKKVSGFVKTKLSEAKEKKALKEVEKKAQAELQEAETDNSEEENSEE